MTTRHYSHSETRKEEHHRLLEKWKNLPLSESCCEICHCDCYSSHRSSELSAEEEEQLTSKTPSPQLAYNDDDIIVERSPKPEDTNNNSNNISTNKKLCDKNSNKAKVAAKNKLKKKKQNSNTAGAIETTCMPAYKNVTKKSSAALQRKSKSPLPQKLPKTLPKRSKSANSIREQTNETLPADEIIAHYTRDCQILQDLLTAFDDTPQLEIVGKTQAKTETMDTSNKKLLTSWPSLQILNSGQTAATTTTAITASSSTLAPLKLCSSMANLCLAPVVREAFQQVPPHDKKILNRMAIKRGEKLMAKENAWLARKYWENERYERELLKCEQMEEYKRAVRDKQFQDYLITKARLNDIAQKDLAELQRLRESLQRKDERTKRRLDAIRVERDIQLCQRRCDELRKCEAVNIQQEEQHLDDTLRKQEICFHLTERLQRADQIRTQMLESYLKRLRYDNYIEQLLHEENWRETQHMELQRREQLKEHISRKRTRSQHFAEDRQRRNEAITKTAQISANLRELVRASVTPEGAAVGATTFAGSCSNVPTTTKLARLLFEKPQLPLMKLSIQ